MFRWRATFCWKAFNKDYNFSLNLNSIGGFHKKLWASKVTRVPISRLPLGSVGTKSHLVVAPVERCRVYYKGEGGGFPQVRVTVSFMSLCLSMVHMCTKNVQTNH